MPLVDYSSSDSERSPPPKKRRKLPSLPPSLAPAVPIDDPSQHQGRIRTTPHVQGQYAAYIYVSLILDSAHHNKLHTLVNQAVAHAKEQVDSLVDIGLDAQGKRELHISLSRPTYLRVHQIDDLKKAVEAIAERHAP
jgi:hypothetical protein